MELTRYPKRQLSSLYSTVIHDGRIAKRSPGDRERNAADPVVDNFVAA